MLVLVPTWARITLRYAVGLTLAAYFVRQFRKPSRWVGRPFLWMMNKSHSPLTDWGLQHVEIGKNFVILDVGCGGGRTIEKLAQRAADGRLHGVDYAKGSVAESRARNTDLIAQGRVAIAQASVSNLPYSDNTFDLVTAVETQYFWLDLVNDMKEVRRVLKPGGTLVVIAEAYKHGPSSVIAAPLAKLTRMSYLSVADYKRLFADSGYSDIQVFEERKRGWICVTGAKSMQSDHFATSGQTERS